MNPAVIYFAILCAVVFFVWFVFVDDSDWPRPPTGYTGELVEYGSAPGLQTSRYPEWLTGDGGEFGEDWGITANQVDDRT